MSLIIKANLKISSLPEDKIFTSKRTGEQYLPVTIVVNDKLNDFGKQGPIFIEQSKEERDVKQPKHYLGDSVVVFNDLDEVLTTKQILENEE